MRWLIGALLSVFAVAVVIASGYSGRIERVIRSSPDCAVYQSEVDETEAGCRDSAGISPCDDGTPWFLNKNYQVQRMHLRKYYSNGTRHLCEPWVLSGGCCNTIAESECPWSNCWAR